jgi:uncharacterized protein (TIGR04255 family)
MFNLPQPRPYRMERPPLAQAVVQVRFPLVARASTLEGIAAFQERLRGSFPYLEQVQQHQLNVLLGPTGPSSSPATTMSTIWKFSNDQGWILALEAGSATLAVGAAYESVADLAERLSQVASALVDTLDVQRCDRIGVRYVDLMELDDPTGEDWRWTEWFRPELRGWLGNEILGEDTMLFAHLTQSQLTSPPTGVFAGGPGPINGIVRHGIVPPGTAIPITPLAPPLQLTETRFLLDQDFFIEAHQAFDVDRLVDQFRRLHSEIESFFRWALTASGEQHFGVVDQ